MSWWRDGRLVVELPEEVETRLGIGCICELLVMFSAARPILVSSPAILPNHRQIISVDRPLSLAAGRPIA